MKKHILSSFEQKYIAKHYPELLEASAALCNQALKILKSAGDRNAEYAIYSDRPIHEPLAPVQSFTKTCRDYKTVEYELNRKALEDILNSLEPNQDLVFEVYEDEVTISVTETVEVSTYAHDLIRHSKALAAHKELQTKLDTIEKQYDKTWKEIRQKLDDLL